LIEQLLDQGSVVNSLPAVKTAAIEAVQRIKAAADSEDDSTEVKVMSFATKQLLAQL